MISHECELLCDSISHLPKIFPNSPWHIRAKRWLKKKILVSIDHPEVHIYLKSKRSIEKESRRQVKHFPGFIIHPLSVFRKYWNLVIFMILLMHQMLTPFAIGFYLDIEESTIDAIIITDMITCFILFIEVLLMFRTGCVIRKTNEITLSPKVIARKYLKNFVPDLICCVPFIYFTTWIIEERGGTINGATVIYMCCLFIFSFWRFNRILFYFSSVPIMMNLSETGTIVITICLRTIYW